jgi:hypothetical protein
MGSPDDGTSITIETPSRLAIFCSVYILVDLHSSTGRDETKRKTQQRMEGRSRKRSSSAGSEKM